MMFSVIAQRTSKYVLQALTRHLGQGGSKNRHKYFAFGANMDLSLLKKKSIFPSDSQAAKVDGYRIEISSPCEWVGKGFASISPARDSQVYGVVHDVTGIELWILDVLEWVPFGFHKRIMVNVSPLGGDAPLTAWAYIAKHPLSGLKTSVGYRDLLVRSARDLGLPAPYLEQLSALPVADSFLLDHGFRLSNPGKRRWLEHSLKPIYQIHDEWREKLCQYLP